VRFKQKGNTGNIPTADAPSIVISVFAAFFFRTIFDGEVTELMLRTTIDSTGADAVVVAAAFAALVARVVVVVVVGVVGFSRASDTFFGFGTFSQSWILQNLFFLACCFHLLMTF